MDFHVHFDCRDIWCVHHEFVHFCEILTASCKFNSILTLRAFPFTAFLHLNSAYCSNCDRENVLTECNPFRLAIIYRAILLVPKRMVYLADPWTNNSYNKQWKK